jgi:uncharacterized protein YutE (UPF0331/DUF86 family)
MTVRKSVVLSRLAHLGKIIRELEKLQSLSGSVRDGDALVNLALERAFQIAAEAIFDIGHHVLAGRGMDVPTAYRDVLPALAQAGVIPEPVAVRLDGLAGLRNILVHDYAVVDRARLWELLDERLDDLRSIHAALSRIPEIQ